ncbi:1300_t:CDS:2 [Cetraspora pellucida]|uniref:1300_t:CDS:1 n=1 Tax=Cetraspora pellucida TaxID=1433469 RepID=A0ACA9LTA2_9GLOM|nr:1300_t:CDS:2 [Cetraspora pellucida]
MRYKDLLNTNDILHLLTNKLSLNLKQKGRSVFFLCPFHSDKNPTQYQKISREEAIVEIGKMGYFDLAILQEEKKREQKEKNQIFYLLSLIADIYQHNLLTLVGQEVLNYLRQERHLDETTINRFGLGCSINNRQLSHLLLDQKNADFPSEDLLATNLVWITDQNQTCDFFPAHHLIIPLANTEGKVVAFAARKVGEISADEGKYKYLPSYQYYQKSALLYNYSTVKKNRAEECYLVEGFFDVISLSKLEIENCLALLGTNLSEEQIKLLLGLKKRIVLFLDNDKAGQEATVNVAIKLLEREIDCEVVKNDYPGDPDEICRQQSQESIQILLHSRENPYSFILKYYFFKLAVRDNPQRTVHFINQVANVFQKFKPNIYDFLIGKISSLTG